MIANQELNKKVRALTGETTPCDVNGNPNRDYAGDIQEAMALADEILRCGYNIEIKITCGQNDKYDYFAAASFDGVRVAIGGDGYTVARSLCSLYLTWREHMGKQ